MAVVTSLMEQVVAVVTILRQVVSPIPKVVVVWVLITAFFGGDGKNLLQIQVPPLEKVVVVAVTRVELLVVGGGGSRKFNWSVDQQADWC